MFDVVVLLQSYIVQMLELSDKNVIKRLDKPTEALQGAMFYVHLYTLFCKLWPGVLVGVWFKKVLLVSFGTILSCSRHMK